MAFRPLSDAEIAEIAEFGRARATAEGELLFAVGEASYDLFVVLEGEVEVLRPPTARGDDRERRRYGALGRSEIIAR